MLVRGLDDAGDHPLLRSLAGLALGWTTRGTIGQAYWLSEWLDCECHHVGSSERAAADAFGADATSGMGG
jgi:hypothetical protein